MGIFRSKFWNGMSLLAVTVAVLLCFASQPMGFGAGSRGGGGAADLSNLNGTNITSGTVASARGGTGVSNAGTITNASNTTITGGGTLALGGFTATVPATGTTALIGAANNFTAANTIASGGSFSTTTNGTNQATNLTGRIYTAAPTAPTSSTSILATNVVTFTTTAAHNMKPFDVVVVASSSHNAAFNGTFVVTDTPTTTTFTYSKTNADLGSAADTATLTVYRPLLVGDTSLVSTGIIKEAVEQIVTNATDGLVVSYGTTATGSTRYLKCVTSSGTSEFYVTVGGNVVGSSFSGTSFSPPNTTSDAIYGVSYGNFGLVNPHIRWPNGSPTVGINYNGAAGVAKVTDGSTGIKGLMGGGAAVASATAMPVPTGRIFHVTGTTAITSITSTNFQAGCVITMIFDGSLTFTNGNNIILAGAANFSATANDTLTMCYDGTNWYEVCRSVN